MLRNMLEVNYLGDADDILITLQRRLKDEQRGEPRCRLIAIKGQHAFKLMKMLSIFISMKCTVYGKPIMLITCI